jgi:hypothetical protein
MCLIWNKEVKLLYSTSVTTVTVFNLYPGSNIIVHYYDHWLNFLFVLCRFLYTYNITKYGQRCKHR